MAKEGQHHGIFICRRVVETIKVVAVKEEAHTSHGVGFHVVIDIACPLKDLQGRVGLDTEMVVRLTKLGYVEKEGVATAIAEGNLVEIGKVLIDVADELLVGKLLHDALVHLSLVVSVVE